jgi:hypothetical protein
MFVTGENTTPFDVCARLGHGEIWPDPTPEGKTVCRTCKTPVAQWVRVEVDEGRAYTYASFEEPPLERGEAVRLPGNVVKSAFTGTVLRDVHPERIAQDDFRGPYKAVVARVEPRPVGDVCPVCERAVVHPPDHGAGCPLTLVDVADWDLL